tara:strand:- start:562 stop:792 length:231 start_codon:yes stop_codon:yes gene_type:complete
MKCFEICEKRSKPCKKLNCRYWINYNNSNNCTILAAREGPMTLQKIGEIFDVTRMRVCQLEKKILKKISFQLDKDL